MIYKYNNSSKDYLVRYKRKSEIRTIGENDL